MSSIEVQPENGIDPTGETGKVPIAGENISDKADEPLPPAYNDISSIPPVSGSGATGVQNTAFSEPTPVQNSVTNQTATTVVTQSHVVAAPAAAVIVQQPMMLGTLPCQTSCPYCSTLTITNTQYVNGPFTWLVCGGVFLFGGCLGCCLIPFCCNDCKDVHHHCSHCGRLISVQSRM